jgi:hypothetical protein
MGLREASDNISQVLMKHVLDGLSKGSNIFKGIGNNGCMTDIDL